jgi:hypothetical protein
MRAAPAVPCAKWVMKTHTSIQVQRRTSDIPCAMALRLIARSPRRRIRLVTVADGLRFCQTRLGLHNLRQLGISNGCQNHTSSPYASTSFVCTPFDRSRVWLNPEPALQFTCAPNAAASTASNPASVTIAIRPSLWDRTAGDIEVIWVCGEAECFCKRDWTGQIMLNSFKKLPSRRNTPAHRFGDQEFRRSCFSRSRVILGAKGRLRQYSCFVLAFPVLRVNEEISRPG